MILLTPAWSLGEDTRSQAGQTPAREVQLRAQIEAAIARLDEAVSGLEGLTTGAATETLESTWHELVAARLQFNAVDHAFKRGRVRVRGRELDTGVTMDTVAPQLRILAFAELRIQDELARRGIETLAGARSVRQWLLTLAPELYHQAVFGYLDRTYPSLVMLPNGLGYEIGRDGLWHQSEASIEWQKAFQRGEMDPRIADAIAHIAPGRLEGEFTRLLSQYGLAPFDKGIGTYELPVARPVPPPPREPKTWDDGSGTGAG